MLSSPFSFQRRPIYHRMFCVVHLFYFKLIRWDLYGLSINIGLFQRITFFFPRKVKNSYWDQSTEALLDEMSGRQNLPSVLFLNRIKCIITAVKDCSLDLFRPFKSLTCNHIQLNSLNIRSIPKLSGVNFLMITSKELSL